MKTLSTIIAFGAASVLFLAVAPSRTLAGGTLAGGYTAAAVTNQEVAAAAEFAIKAEGKAIGADAKLELAGIQSAETQVVAGVNYRLKLKVKQDGKERIADAVVWWQAWRKPEPYQLTSWKWE